MTDNKDLNNKFELEDDELTGVNGGNMAMQNLIGGGRGPVSGFMHGNGKGHGLGKGNSMFTQQEQNPFGQDGQNPFSQDGQNPFGQKGKNPFSQDGQNPFGQSGKGGL